MVRWRAAAVATARGGSQAGTGCRCLPVEGAACTAARSKVAHSHSSPAAGTTSATRNYSFIYLYIYCISLPRVNPKLKTGFHWGPAYISDYYIIQCTYNFAHNTIQSQIARTCHAV